MNSEILNYTLKLTVLGPLFIGSGEQLDKSEYIFNRNSNKFHVMDKTKMFEGLKKRGLADKFAREIMTTKGFNLYGFCKENNIPSNEYIKWARYSFNIQEGTDFKKTTVLTMIKDPYGLPYVPGSSVKGALRTAVLNYELLNHNNRYNDVAEKIENERFDPNHRKQYLSKLTEKLEIRAFHTLNKPDTKTEDAVNSIFSGLRIGDSKPLSLNDLRLCPKLDVFPDDTYNNIPIHRECLAPNTVVELPVQIDKKIFPYDAEQLCKCIQAMYNMEAERFLSKFPDFEKEDGTVLYLGGGSGFVSKTVIYSLYKDPRKALDIAAKILDKVDSDKTDNRGNKIKDKNGVPEKTGDHLKDPRKFGTSPHIRKRTVCDDYEDDFGLCEVEFVPVK